MVEGVLNTRYMNKEVQCECGEISLMSKSQTEIIGTTVEYLNNCKFDKEEVEKNIQNKEMSYSRKLNFIFIIIGNLFKNKKIKKVLKS